LQRIIVGRVTFWPMRARELQQEDGYTPWVAGQNGYRFEAQTRFDKLFSGVVPASAMGVPPFLASYGLDNWFSTGNPPSGVRKSRLRLRDTQNAPRHLHSTGSCGRRRSHQGFRAHVAGCSRSWPGGSA